MEFDLGNTSQGHLPLKQIIFTENLDPKEFICKHLQKGINHPVSIIITIVIHCYSFPILLQAPNGGWGWGGILLF